MRFNTLVCYTFFSIVPSILRAQVSDVSAEFRDLIRQRNVAIATSDTVALRRLISADLTWVIGTTGQTISASQLITAASRPAPQTSIDIDSVAATVIGAVAIVAFRRTDHYRMGTDQVQYQSRVLETFKRAGGSWVLNNHTQTWIVAAPKPTAADSVGLAGFIGRYELAPGYVDDVHWENGGLVATATGEANGAELTRVGASSFRPSAQLGTLITFERNATGRVVGYLFFTPDGQAKSARRLN